MTNRDLQYHLRGQETRLNRVNNQIGSQGKIGSLRDDPIAAGHLVRYKSFLTRVQNFEKNAQTLADKISVAEGYLSSSLDVVHRVRTLAVQAANGTYTRDDLRLMSAEVDELLKELVQNANGLDGDGNLLFAGTKTKGAAFEPVVGAVPGAAEPMITEVRYAGNVDVNSVEVDEGATLPVDRAGDRIFWAERQRLTAQRDHSAFRVPEDSMINVDGVTIALKAGDNVSTVAAKINDSGAAVRAEIDPGTRGLALTTTDSRQLWLQDAEGTILRDLGLIGDSSQRPPNNIAAGSAQISGGPLKEGSLFEAVIALRDAMLAGDQESIGGKVLGALDQGFDNLNTRIARLGSDYERAALNAERNSATALNVTAEIAREGDLDMTEALMNLKMLELVQQATLAVSARIHDNTLLNYLR
jgi:flagellar hook-associated protein 3 FlgL